MSYFNSMKLNRQEFLWKCFDFLVFAHISETALRRITNSKCLSMLIVPFSLFTGDYLFRCHTNQYCYIISFWFWLHGYNLPFQNEQVCIVGCSLWNNADHRWSPKSEKPAFIFQIRDLQNTGARRHLTGGLVYSLFFVFFKEKLYW